MGKQQNIYTVDVSNQNFVIKFSPSTRYGYFERVSDGVEGGLWFDATRTMIDYDGVSVLPLTVCRQLVNSAQAFKVPDEFWPNGKVE